MSTNECPRPLLRKWSTTSWGPVNPNFSRRGKKLEADQNNAFATTYATFINKPKTQDFINKEREFNESKELESNLKSIADDAKNVYEKKFTEVQNQLGSLDGLGGDAKKAAQEVLAELEKEKQDLLDGMKAAEEELKIQRRERNNKAKALAAKEVEEAKADLEGATTGAAKNYLVKQMIAKLGNNGVVDVETGDVLGPELDFSAEDVMSADVLAKNPELENANIVVGGKFKSFTDKTAAENAAPDPTSLVGKLARVILSVGEFTCFKGEGNKKICFKQLSTEIIECTCSGDVTRLKEGDKKCCANRCFVAGSATYTGTQSQSSPGNDESSSAAQASPFGAFVLAALSFVIYSSVLL